MTVDLWQLVEEAVSPLGLDVLEVHLRLRVLDCLRDLPRREEVRDDVLVLAFEHDGIALLPMMHVAVGWRAGVVAEHPQPIEAFGVGRAENL